MKILKFGGSSVGSAERIKGVIEILNSTFQETTRGAVIFSAYQGVTDKLIKAGTIAASGNVEYLKIYKELHNLHISIAKELISTQRQENSLIEITATLNQLDEILHGIYLIRELSPKTLDYLVSFGERLSTYTISECLQERGFKNSYLDTRNIIKTDNNFGKARVIFSLTNSNITSYFEAHPEIQITTGYIASNLEGETTTLGRGGSDYSASILGAALQVEEIEIWTDVDGILTADPRKVPDAFSIPEVSYEEAMELSHFGAKVIYPPTMQPALDKEIPIRIKNTFNPSFEGTVIREKVGVGEYSITGISSIDNIALLTIGGSGMIGVAGIAERIFGALARKNISIILITQASSEHTICLAILPQYQEAAVKALQDELKYEIRDGIVSEIEVENNFSILAVVGENMRHRKGLAGRVFKSLGDNDINITAIAQGSSELNISMVVSKDDEVRALNTIHSAFFDSGLTPIDLFLVGPGQIGSQFLSLINDVMQKENSFIFRVVGLANSKRMIFNQTGINLATWKTELQKSVMVSDLDKYIENMKRNHSSNSVFVDCTASEVVVDKYLDILKSNISIVSANKKANARTYSFYSQLRKTARRHQAYFLYETNVGAGLPVINTLQNLLYAGDEIYKIEGILSGTLSYIFNTFSSQKSFSQVVLEAKQKGYTEPDPREDLNGLDVARKLLILAREIGYPLELSDIAIENLIPDEARSVNTIDDFFKSLAKHDDAMRKQILKAEQNGEKLRYIAKIEEGKASVALLPVKQSHPFYQMEGSDNIIAIYSKFYVTPLLIKGAGAGTNVTAAGVFADVLKAARKA